MSEPSSPSACTTSSPSNRTPSSSVLESFIYAPPSVHERLAYGVLVPEAERVALMADLAKELERVIDGQ